MSAIEGFIAINPPERKRTYHFPNGQKLVLEHVTAVLVRPSGTHRVELNDGRKFIVPPTWIGIELDIDHWTF